MGCGTGVVEEDARVYPELIRKEDDGQFFEFSERQQALACETWNSSRAMKWTVFIVLIATCLILIVLALNRKQGLGELKSMYSPNAKTEIVSIFLEGQQRQTNIINPEIISFFNKSFHSSGNAKAEAGLAYEAVFTFSSGKTIITFIHIHQNLNGFSVAIPSFWNIEEPQRWGVAFVQPVPDAVQGLMESLSK